MLRWWLRLPSYIVNGAEVALGIAVIQIVFGALAGFHAAQLASIGAVCASLADVPNTPSRAWRQLLVAAVLACVAAFAVHLWYEHARLQSPPRRAALHVSLAVALGAFLLAVWINVHAYWSAAGHPRPIVLLALVLFPVVTGAPAFVVALIVTSLLVRRRVP